MTRRRSRVAANFARLTYDLKRDILRAMGVRVTLCPAGHEPRHQIEAPIPLAEDLENDRFAHTTHRPIFVLINRMYG